jgi:hypothetical protein
MILTKFAEVKVGAAVSVSAVLINFNPKRCRRV